MSLFSTKTLQDWIFSGIVFNMSWEDPYMDRDALQVGPGDTCASICSGGCNCLSLLCWNPDKVIVVDGNPSQTYLMELKLAAIRTLDWREFSDIFGAFDVSRLRATYTGKLRPLLSDGARKFWDSGRNFKMLYNLHSAGRNGVFLKLLRMYLASVLDKGDLEKLFTFDDPADVERHYTNIIEPRIFSTMIRRVCEVGKAYFYLAGVHPVQLEVVERHMPMWDYLRLRVRRLVCENLPRDNYFIASGGLGKFMSRKAVPPYLQEQHFDTLRKNVDKLKLHIGWLNTVLDTYPEGSVTKYSLLDIFDWMDETLFENVLRSVIRAARDGALLIYRSGGVVLDPPKGVIDALPSSPEQRQLAKALLDKDLSGIYMSFQLRQVDKSQLRPAKGAVATAAVAH